MCNGCLTAFWVDVMYESLHTNKKSNTKDKLKQGCEIKTEDLTMGEDQLTMMAGSWRLECCRLEHCGLELSGTCCCWYSVAGRLSVVATSMPIMVEAGSPLFTTPEPVGIILATVELPNFCSAANWNCWDFEDKDRFHTVDSNYIADKIDTNWNKSRWTGTNYVAHDTILPLGH